MLLNYHIGRLVLSSSCVGAFGAAAKRTPPKTSWEGGYIQGGYVQYYGCILCSHNTEHFNSDLYIAINIVTLANCRL